MSTFLWTGGVRKRVLNQSGGAKGKQSIEQMQRDFFRKKPKDAAVEQVEATVQDTFFEKLELSVNRNLPSKSSLNNQQLRRETHLEGKAAAHASISRISSEIQRSLPLGKPIAAQPLARKRDEPSQQVIQTQGSRLLCGSVQPKFPKPQALMTTPSRIPHNGETKAIKLLSASSSCIPDDVSQVLHTIIEEHHPDNTKMTDKKRNSSDAATQCFFEPEVPRLKLNIPTQSFQLQLPTNFSELPRKGQYLFS
jgi:hypothetical protein